MNNKNLMQKKSLKVAAIQFDINWLNPSKNLSKLDQLLEQVERPDLILLPETFSTGFAIDVDGAEELVESSVALKWLKQKAIQFSAVIAATILIKQKDKKVNRFYWVFPDGKTEYYDKRHLFRIGNEHQHVNAGAFRKVVDVNGIKIMANVCYDLRFPVWSRNTDNYDLLVNVANWPAVRRDAWDTLLKARAIENQCYVVGVNRVGSDGKKVAHSGGTQCIDAYGQIIASASDNQEVVLQFILDFNEQTAFREKFPVLNDQDPFQLL